MTVYCPKCGGQTLTPRSDPMKIDEEVNQVLFQQFEECNSCGHQWADKWWRVMGDNGEWYNVDADEFGNAKK